MCTEVFGASVVFVFGVDFVFGVCGFLCLVGVGECWSVHSSRSLSPSVVVRSESENQASLSKSIDRELSQSVFV